MGLLYTTPGTRNVLDTLNTAFDGPGKGLDVIRSAASPGSPLGKKIAKRDWKPGRLAWMLKLMPYDQGTSPGPVDPAHSKKWHYFLKNVVGPSAAFVPIRNALADAILNQDSSGAALNIIRVSFDHVELALPPTGGSANPNVVIFDAPLPGFSGGIVRQITLFTVPVPLSQPGTPFDPSDPGEPTLPVKPPWEKP